MAYMTIYCIRKLFFTFWIMTLLEQPFLVSSSLQYPELECVPLHPPPRVKKPTNSLSYFPWVTLWSYVFFPEFSEAVFPCIPLPRQKNLGIYFSSNLKFVQSTETPPLSVLILLCTPMRCFVSPLQTKNKTTQKPASPCIPSQDRNTFPFPVTVSLFLPSPRHLFKFPFFSLVQACIL